MAESLAKKTQSNAAGKKGGRTGIVAMKMES